MRIATACSFFLDRLFAWSADWAWGLPLTMLTVLIHVSGLALIGQKVIHAANFVIEHRHSKIAFVCVVGATTLSATVLHGIEAGIWAIAYSFLGALPNFQFGMLYSLNAITSYGHTGIMLEERWHMMGALESLNGSLLFGLSTAFLFAVIQKVWVLGDRSENGWAS